MGIGGGKARLLSALVFFLGTHETNWLGRTEVPLFVSHRRLAKRRRLPVASGPWALDSGGFSELSLYGRWVTNAADYVGAVSRYQAEIGGLAWVAPQDWMCEPTVRERTGLTVAEHQARTLESYLRLRDELGHLVIPVLQGWLPDEYLEHWQAYERAGVSLEAAEVVGVGSVCRRHGSAGHVFRRLDGLRLHGFGVKTDGLRSYSDKLVSADSMAWSYDARRACPLPGCTHKNCANCLRYALLWRERVLRTLAQERLAI